MSPSCGVPYNVLLSLSIESHDGGSINEYDKVESEEVKVEGEKMNEKGCDILATGGTWELIGNETVGAACTTTARDKVRRMIVLAAETIVSLHNAR